MVRALLLVNRHSRQGQDNLSTAVSELEKLGFDLIEEPIEDPEKLPDVIRRYGDRVDMVIVGGGDGTLNAAVAGIVDTQLPLGILPLGTANDLARTLGIPQAIPEACQVLVNGVQQRIDLGWVNDKYFFNVASLGLSVEITQQLNKEAKRRWGVFAYALTAMRVIWQTRPFGAEIAINGESVKVKTVQIAVGNGRYYGGGMAIAEDATIDDQRLDLYSLEMSHWWQIAFWLPAMWRGSHESWRDVRTFQGQEIGIYTRRSRPISADGEIVTSTPAHFRLIPEAISVFVPESASQ